MWEVKRFFGGINAIQTSAVSLFQSQQCEDIEKTF